MRQTTTRRILLGTATTLGCAGLAAGVVVGAHSPAGFTVISGQGTPDVALLPTRNGTGSGPSGPSTGAATSVTGAAAATSAQQAGVVDIDTVLQYQQAEAAGTGMVLTSTGEVLTNNHVVDGATSIKVTVVSTGASYTARVVGTDPTADIAVLQLSGASGLQTANIAGAAPTVGEAVTAVGNAGGTGGTPSAAAGTITALDQSITAADENGSNAERLTGLIETDADVQAGDSGGPLYDAAGSVIGMDTAASTGRSVQGYAIPIATAEAIAAEIESGVSSATIHQGYPAFLGVSVQSSGDGGALIAGVVRGGPADTAGITPGDVVTAVGGTPVTSASSLSAAIAAFTPGQPVTVTWTATDGSSRSATAVMATGPAD